MKAYRIAVAVMVLAVLCLWGVAALAQEHAHEHQPAEKQEAEEAQAPSGAGIKEMKGNICPIMGGAINKKYSYVYKGTTYYFCCPACIEKFKAEPEKYIEKISCR